VRVPTGGLTGSCRVALPRRHSRARRGPQTPPLWAFAAPQRRVAGRIGVEARTPAVALVDFGGAPGRRVCVGLSGERGERTERTDLSPMVREVLLRCAASCERALIDYREVAGSTVTGRELFGDLLRSDCHGADRR
jgi:hypothetical protein